MTGLERGVSVGEIGPKVRQSVRPTECGLGRTRGFSKVALGHHVVSWVSGLAGQGYATAHPLGHVYGAFCVDAVAGTSAQHQVVDG